MYVYTRTEPTLWTVGFYTPDGEWRSHDDFDSKKEAGDEVARLNGSGGAELADALDGIVDLLERIVKATEQTASNVIDVESEVEKL